jgi:dimethylhistidine N-methyltransferase
MDDHSIDREFAEAVRAGLSATPKHLSSRYFYDAAGDRLFQQIMRSPEYYLTDAEREILREQGPAIARVAAAGGPFELIELGAGDGSKICHLIDALHALDADFVFKPLDISPHVLDLLEARLRPDRPWLRMESIAGNYMHWLAEERNPGIRRVFAFMGSNLGNFAEPDAVDFLSAIRQSMTPGDHLLIGLDLKKEPSVIKAAYNDAAGITAQFNLNLLTRINRELEADFELDGFSHQPDYLEDTGAARSFLRSEREQQVYIGVLGERFNFARGELIHMEISQKYDQAMIDRLASAAGFEVEAVFTDERDWFTDQLWRPVGGH